MEKWINKVAVVTGASSGIGYAVVEKLLVEGMLVVGFARRIDRMEEHARKLEGKKGAYYPIKCDMSREDDILNAFAYIKENLGPVHVLINNAGKSNLAGLIDGDTEMWRDVLNVNILALCIATREAIRSMRESNVDGVIINVNSIFGHNIAPKFPLCVYGATKFAVTALCKILKNELNNIQSKIKVTSISPGITVTEIFEAAGADYETVKAAHDNHMPYIKPEDIADGILYILSTPPNVNVAELTIKEVNETFC